MSSNHWRSSMRRRVILIVAVLHLFGTFGSPVVAYSCAESGDSGVLPYLAWSLRSSCADSCCEDDQGTPNAHVERGISCCDIDLQTMLPRSRVLPPDRKSVQAETCEDASDRPNIFKVSVLVVDAPPSTQACLPPINTPLRI